MCDMTCELWSLPCLLSSPPEFMGGDLRLNSDDPRRHWLADCVQFTGELRYSGKVLAQPVQLSEMASRHWSAEPAGFIARPAAATTANELLDHIAGLGGFVGEFGKSVV
jgi:hypothetical protein